MVCVVVDYAQWTATYVEEQKLPRMMAPSRVPCVGEFVILDEKKWRVLSVTHRRGFVIDNATITVEPA